MHSVSTQEKYRVKYIRNEKKYNNNRCFHFFIVYLQVLLYAYVREKR